MERVFESADFDTRAFVRGLYDGSLLKHGVLDVAIAHTGGGGRKRGTRSKDLGLGFPSVNSLDTQMGSKDYGSHNAFNKNVRRNRAGGPTVAQRVLETTQKAFGFKRTAKGNTKKLKRTRPEMDILDSSIMTKDDILRRVDELQERNVRRLKRDIASQYNYFIAAARDARQVGHLSQVLKAQVKESERILQKIQRNHQNVDTLIKQTNTMTGKRFSSESQTSGGSEVHHVTKVDDEGNGQTESIDRFNPWMDRFNVRSNDWMMGRLQETICFDDVNFEDAESRMLAQLRVLIVQRRLEDAVKQASAMIDKCRQEGETTVLKDDARECISHIRRLIISEIKNTHVEDIQRQRVLIRYASKLKVAITVVSYVLEARSKLMKRRLRTAVMASMNCGANVLAKMNVDDSPTTFSGAGPRPSKCAGVDLMLVKLACQAITSTVRVTVEDFRTAFSQTEDWTKIICILLTWAHSSCLKSLLRVLLRGPLNSIAATGCLSNCLDSVAIAANKAISSKSRKKKRRQSQREKDLIFSIDFETSRMEKVISLSFMAMETSSPLDSIGFPFSVYLRYPLLEQVSLSCESHVRGLKSCTEAIINGRFLPATDDFGTRESRLVSAINTATQGICKIFLLCKRVAESPYFSDAGATVCLKTTVGLCGIVSWIVDEVTTLFSVESDVASSSCTISEFSTDCNPALISGALLDTCVKSGLDFLRNEINSCKCFFQYLARVNKVIDEVKDRILKICALFNSHIPQKSEANVNQTEEFITKGQPSTTESEPSYSSSDLGVDNSGEEEDCWL